MEKLIKITKIIFKATVLIVVVIPLGMWLMTYILPKLGFNYAFNDKMADILFTALLYGFPTALAIVSLVAILFVLFLPFWILKKRKGASEENNVTKLHLFILFTPLVSVLLWVLVWFLPSPHSTLCAIALYPINYKTIYTLLSLFPFVLIFSAFLTALVLYFYKKRKDKIALLALRVLTSFILALLIASFFLSSGITPRRKSPDARRISDVKQMQLALEFYHDEFGTYPQVNGGNPFERWQGLDILVSKGYIARVPSDPCGSKFSERQYDYKNSPDSTSYVVKVILEDQYYGALSADIDGEIFGIWCGEEGKEREYCAMP